ncbi:hypothetical protein FRC08_010576 [Ceratobasidium sp. 394]|nr:hypothetical protein FRC08_010576 [Ceratobasidium sp. 394]
MAPQNSYTLTTPAASYQPTEPRPHYPYITSSQPTGQRGMVVAPPTEEPAERLRGGCIPLPNGGRCWIIPIPLCC